MSTRVAELRPLVDEHRRIEAALRALGDATIDVPAAPASPPAPARARAGKATAATRRKRAPRGANRNALLRALDDRPGATGAELATVSGVERNTLQSLLTRLVKEGQVQTQSLPTGRTGYILSPPARPGWSSTASVADESSAADEPPASPAPPTT